MYCISYWPLQVKGYFLSMCSLERTLGWSDSFHRDWPLLQTQLTKYLHQNSFAPLCSLASRMCQRIGDCVHVSQLSRPLGFDWQNIMTDCCESTPATFCCWCLVSFLSYAHSKICESVSHMPFLPKVIFFPLFIQCWKHIWYGFSDCWNFAVILFFKIVMRRRVWYEERSPFNAQKSSLLQHGPHLCYCSVSVFSSNDIQVEHKSWWHFYIW